MKLAERLEHSWRTLEAGNGNEALVRSLGDLGLADTGARLGLDATGCRELLFPIATREAVRETIAARGVKVLVRTESGSAGARHNLVLRCLGQQYHGVFKRFAAAVLEDLSDATDPALAALAALQNWRDMFGRAGAETSEAFLCGVFGELHELLGLVQRSSNAVAAWSGPYARPQDFIRGGYALEVKSSRSHAHEVEVHGLEQLWARPLEILVLVAKQVALDPAGRRVTDLVSEILSNGGDSTTMDSALEAYGMDLGQLRLAEGPRFTHRASRYFRVTAGSPLLTPDSLSVPALPTGVSGVRYVLALDAPALQPLDGAELDDFLRRMSG